MKKSLFLIALMTLLGGCSTAPKPDQVPASQWVNEQIVQSATSLSQAQQRLHQTSSAQPAKPSGGG